MQTGWSYIKDPVDFTNNIKNLNYIPESGTVPQHRQ